MLTVQYNALWTVEIALLAQSLEAFIAKLGSLGSLLPLLLGSIDGLFLLSLPLLVRDTAITAAFPSHHHWSAGERRAAEPV